MLQVLYCECGGRDMLNGRCTKCNRVRPSRQELLDQIVKLDIEITELRKQLVKVIKLEEGR